MRILLTGGAGYVGSHALVELLAAGHDTHVVDSLVHGQPEALQRVRALTGRDFGFTRADVRDSAAMAALVGGFAPEAVIHFAALKSPAESIEQPTRYFDVNVTGLRVLMAALQASKCRRFVFSSSAAVYGVPEHQPVDEEHPLRPTTPYGQSKLEGERVLRAFATADPSWSIALLRYFNPVGAHVSGRIGEAPTDSQDTLVRLIADVALGRRTELRIFGADYATPDGSGVRDFIHVTDLARAHIAAVTWTTTARGAEAFNLGTGRGISVRQMVDAFAAACGRPIPTRIAPRRPGDVGSCYADPRRAEQVLGWRAALGVTEMCASAWAWVERNPEGYGEGPDLVTKSAIAFYPQVR